MFELSVINDDRKVNETLNVGLEIVVSILTKVFFAYLCCQMSIVIVVIIPNFFVNMETYLVTTLFTCLFCQLSKTMGR